MEQRTQTVGELSAAHEVSQYLSKENDTLQAQVMEIIPVFNQCYRLYCHCLQVQQVTSQLAEEMERVEKVKELYREEVQNLTGKVIKLLVALW